SCLSPESSWRVWVLPLRCCRPSQAAPPTLRLVCALPNIISLLTTPGGCDQTSVSITVCVTSTTPFPGTHTTVLRTHWLWQICRHRVSHDSTAATVRRSLTIRLAPI